MPGPLRSGAFAAVACAGAGAAGVAAGFSRGQGPGLGSALLAMVRFRGAARGPLPSWPALRCGGLFAGPGAGVACAGRGLCAAGPLLPGCGLPGANNNPTNIAKNQCRANINHNILSPQHAILPHSSQKACRGDLPGWLARSPCRLAPLCQQSSGACSKSFWDSPLVEGPARHVHPKTTTFCLVLGFTPSREACRAHQSQNDLEQGYSAILITAKAQRPPPQIAIF